MFSTLLALLDWFIPAWRKTDPVRHRQSYLAIGMLLLVVLSMPLNMTQQISGKHWLLLGMSTTTLVLYLGLMVAYRYRDLHRVAVFVMLFWGTGAIIGTALMSGALYSAVTPFLAVVPLMALTMTDRRGAVTWTLIAVLSLLGISAITVFRVDIGVPTETFQEPLPWTLNLLLQLGYVALVAWFTDSLHQLRQDQLAAEKSRADDANAAKSAFLANMSHELRTPMNGVLGLTEITLTDASLAPEHRARLQTVLDSGRTLVDLLNDILDLSKVEAGRVVLEEIAWSPAQVATDVHRLFDEVARRKGLAFHLDLEASAPSWVTGDPTRVRQVLCNLVGNAVKFTDTGEVRLTLHTEPGRLRFTVSDTGPGISPSAHARMFEPFTQADSSTARRHGGTGLGLTISRRLTELMDGELLLDSTVGVGSHFTVELPLVPAEAPSDTSELDADDPSVRSGIRRLQAVLAPDSRPPVSPAAEDADYSGCRVLLVEDVPVNQAVATTMLEALHIQVELAEDGAQALAMILGDPTYDLVLMDWHLPEMDGTEVTRLVRLSGHTLPIVGFTASVRPEERKEALASGMDDFLGKPFSNAELCATLARHLSATTEDRATA